MFTRLLKSAIISSLLFCGCSVNHERNIPQLTIQLKEFPDSFNPLSSNDFDGMVFQYLTESDSLGNKSSNLLEKFEQIVINDTINEIHFELKQAIKWHDGNDVTRDDVLFTLKLSKWKQVLASNTSSLNLSPIKTFKHDANNPRAFTIGMQGNPEFNKAIAGDYLIMPEHIFDSLHLLRKYDLRFFDGLVEETCPEDLKAYVDTFNQIPPYDERFLRGSGPYEIRSFVPAQSVTLTYRINWWQKVPNYVSLPDEINYLVVTDATSARFALQSGELDLVTQLPAAEFKQLEEFNASANSLNLYKQAGFKFAFIGFNSRVQKLSDKKTRQALAMLLDYEGIIAAVRLGYAERTVGPVHPILEDLYNSNLQLYMKDPESAKLLLSEAGWTFSRDAWVDAKGEKLSFNLLYNAANQDFEKIALIFQSEAEKIGVNINLIPDEASSISKKVRSHNFEATIWSFVGSSKAFNFSPILHTDAAQPGRLNFTGFGSETSDEAIEKAVASKSREEMAIHLKELQSLINEECPMIFLYFEKSLIGASKKQKRLNIGHNRPGYDIVGVL